MARAHVLFLLLAASISVESRYAISHRYDHGITFKVSKRVIENVACDPLELVDYSENESDDAVCLNTVQGRVCCACDDDVDEEQLRNSLMSGKGSKVLWIWTKRQRDLFKTKWDAKPFRGAWDPLTHSLDK